MARRSLLVTLALWVALAMGWTVQAAASEAYRIQPGDVVEILVYGQPDLSVDVLVLPDGTISYPFAGMIDVRHWTPEQLAAEITGALSAVVRTPVVSVSVRPGRGHSVVILGEVRSPGVYTIPDESIDLLEAIALAGGTTGSADVADVKVYERGNIRSYTEAPVGAGNVLFAGDAAVNPRVAAGNIIFVPPLERELDIVILGEVRSPGAYPVERGETLLLDIIARAGGTTATADLARVRIYERGDVRDYNEAPIGAEGILFEGEAAVNPRVRPGNIIYVPPIDREQLEVYVLGEVRSPGAYAIEPGRDVRLLDIIARAGGTTASADLERVKVYDRGNIHDYTEAPIGAEGILFEGEAAVNPAIAPGNIVYVPPAGRQQLEVYVLGEVRSPGAYAVEPGRETLLLDIIARAGGTTAAADLARVRVYERGNIRDYTEAPIGAEGVLFEGEAAVNPAIAAGNIIYVPPVAPLERQLEIFVLGEVRSPGAYSIEPGRDVRLLDIIARAGGPTAAADLERVKVYDRGNIQDYTEAPIGAEGILFEGAAAVNPALVPGNIIYVPRRTAEVMVMGLVARPGTYEVRPGERILGIISQAGGLLSDADASAVALRRELPSGEVVTTLVDLERILSGADPGANQLLQHGDVIFVRPTIQVGVSGAVRSNGVFRLKSNARVSDAILAAGGVSDSADASRITITRTTGGSQEVLTVDFEAILAGTGENPLLENGDIISVPRTSRVVYVTGEVARPGVYSYTPGARLIDIVYQAGGPTAEADVDAVTVYEEYDVELFSGSLYLNPPVQPGQTVHVPSRVIEVYVVGDAARTGRVTVPRSGRILDLVAALGGPQPGVNWRAVQVYRTLPEETVLFTVDVEALLEDPAQAPNLRLQSGDVVYIPADVVQVSILGEVDNPGTYTLRRNTRLVDALAAAGGARSEAALQRVNLLQSGDRLEVDLGRYGELDVEKIQDSPELVDGGIVVVPRSSHIRWQDIVTFLSAVKLIKDLLN